MNVSSVGLRLSDTYSEAGFFLIFIRVKEGMDLTDRTIRQINQ